MYIPTAQPTIESLPAPIDHTEGDRFELVCTFTGIPAPDIYWEKDGSVFLLGEDRRVINSTGRSHLEINSLALSDAGVYSCSVMNIAGNVTRSVNLKVIGQGVMIALIWVIPCQINTKNPYPHRFEHNLVFTRCLVRY